MVRVATIILWIALMVAGLGFWPVLVAAFILGILIIVDRFLNAS